MVRVTRDELPEKQLRKLDEQLARTLTNFSNDEATLFLRSLLGKEERTVMVKRYAALLLLQKGHSAKSVAESLHMSISTISVLRKEMREGKYAVITNICADQDSPLDLKTILEGIENILSLGGRLPMYGDSLGSVVGQQNTYRKKNRHL